MVVIAWSRSKSYHEKVKPSLLHYVAPFNIPLSRIPPRPYLCQDTFDLPNICTAVHGGDMQKALMYHIACCWCICHEPCKCER